MTEYIFTIVFVIAVSILGIFAKKFLYVYEHEPSIQNELKTFNDNFEAVESTNIIPDYKLGTGHLYE